MLTPLDIVTYLQEQEDRFTAGSPGFSDDADAIEMLGWCRLIGKQLKALSDRVDPIALDMAERMPKNFSHAGFSFIKKEGAAKFSYDHIATIADLKEETKREEEKAKIAAQLLMSGKVLLKDGGIYLESTGEMVMPAKVEYGKASLSLDKQ